MLDWVPGGDYLKNLNVTGDIAGLAASQAGVESGEASLAQNRINNDGNRAIDMARQRAEFEKEQLRFRSSSDSTRASTVNATAAFGFQGQTQSMQAQYRSMQEQARLRSVKDEGVLGQSMVSQMSDNATRMRGEPDAAFVQLSGESAVFTQASKQYADAKAALDATMANSAKTDEQRTLAMEKAKFYQDEMVKKS